MELNRGIPEDILTTRNKTFRRLRVDTGQTGFFEGREFRAFYEFSITSGSNVNAVFTIPHDWILWEQSLTADSGGIKLEYYIGANVSVAFANTLPIIGKNRMVSRLQPYYTSNANIMIGGNFTGGTLLDVARVKAADQSVSATSIGGHILGERGLPAGTYFVRLHNFSSDTARGVLNLFWEERPPGIGPS